MELLIINNKLKTIGTMKTKMKKRGAGGIHMMPDGSMMSNAAMMKKGSAKKYLNGGTTGPGDELAKAAGTGKKLTPTTTKNNGAKSSKEPILKTGKYGIAMKPMKPMMQMGGTTLKKAMYGTMMKPKMMIKGSTKKK